MDQDVGIEQGVPKPFHLGTQKTIFTVSTGPLGAHTENPARTGVAALFSVLCASTHWITARIGSGPIE